MRTIKVTLNSGRSDVYPAECHDWVVDEAGALHIRHLNEHGALLAYVASYAPRNAWLRVMWVDLPWLQK